MQPAAVLNCGHCIHSHCQSQMLRTGNQITVRCPICSASMFNMETEWRRVSAG